MEIRQTAKADAIVFEVAGEIDLYNSGNLKSTLMALVARPPRMALVDLAGVSYVDSSGIGALISGKGALAKAGCVLAICNPASSVRAVLRMTKLLSFFQVYESQEEALNAPREVSA